MLKPLIRLGWAVPLILLAACSGVFSAPTATPAPPAATLPAAAATSTPLTATPPASLSAGPLRAVPRNRTLNLGWFIGSPIGVTNPLNVEYTQQEGNNLLWEGLAYYAIFADKEIPWLAQSMTYNADFTELTIKLNPLARWSDGQPVTAQDVIFTLDAQLNDNQQYYYSILQEFLQSSQALDDLTVTLTFKKPAPRFKFEVLTLKFDSGTPIVPAHALAQQTDLYDFAGGLDLPHSGPYNLVAWDVNGKTYDLRSDWWAVKAGLIKMPDVERVMMVNLKNEGSDTIAASVVANELDASVDLDSAVIANIIKRNPAVTTYSGNAPPYGNLDWWPNSLWVNTQLAPYSDVRVRRALSRAIDRAKIDQVVYQGASIATVYPFPLYPGLQRFADSPVVKALEAQYQPGKFDLAESAQLMMEAGFTKNADGLWADAHGQTVNATINGFSPLDDDLAPVLAEMLKAAGFNAVANFGVDAYQNMLAGEPGLYLFGHGASLVDPFATFDIYHSRLSAPSSSPAIDDNFSRYNNPAYDQIVDAMAVLPADDPKFQALAVQAMEIYWRDVIDIPVVQWLHRIPYNQTYWTNWPTKDNPALGTNGAFWAQTGMLLVTSLQPAQ